MRPRAVIFDFDNTLAHTSGAADAAIADVLHACGCTIPPVRMRCIIRRARSDSELVLATLRSNRQRALEEIGRAQLASVESLLPDANILTMIHRIAELCPVYVCSGRDGPSLALALARTGLAPHVTAVAAADPLCTKPRPGLLRRLMRQHRLAPHEVVYVGDLLTDYWAAVNACCPFLGATWFHDRLPRALPRCDAAADVPAALLEDQMTRSRRLPRRAAAVRPKSGYSRNGSA